jgi:hypothetical protein
MNKKPILVLRKKVEITCGEKPKLILRGGLAKKIEKRESLLRDKVKNGKFVEDKIKVKKKKKNEDEEVHIPHKIRHMINYWNKVAEKNLIFKKVVFRNNTSFKKTTRSCNLFLKGELCEDLKTEVPLTFKQCNTFGGEKTVEDFCLFVDRFDVVIQDKKYYPSDKAPLKKNPTLSSFLQGNIYSGQPSYLLAHCWREPRLIIEHQYPHLHKCVELAWTRYEPNHKIIFNDYLVFDKMLCWLIPFLKMKMQITNEIKVRQIISTLLIQSIESGWKTSRPSVNYLASEKCKEEFEKYLRKLGY